LEPFGWDSRVCGCDNVVQLNPTCGICSSSFGRGGPFFPPAAQLGD
jgi:hypothetical protein